MPFGIVEIDLTGMPSAIEAPSMQTSAQISEETHPPEIPKAKVLLTYPQSCGVSISLPDYRRITGNRFLNDVIIDFYLKYIYYEKLNSSQQKSSFIFSSYFYRSLTADVKKETDVKEAAKIEQERRYQRVKSWTKNVDIFEKETIIIPVNSNNHWILAIIHCPGKLSCCPEVLPASENQRAIKASVEDICKDREYQGRVDSTPVEASNSLSIDGNQCAEMPCICIFDSLSESAINPCADTLPNVLREYLKREYKERKGRNIICNDKTMKSFNMNVPQQTNDVDCGIYLLQYAESFFEKPFKFGNPMPNLKDWCPASIFKAKREVLRDLIEKLHNNQENDAKQ